MKGETLEYIRYRLSRAEATSELAQLAVENGFLYDAVNRLYYACFFAVSALLLTEGHSASRHGGVQGLFDRHWIHTGRLPTSMGRFFHRIYRYRQKSDYADLVTFERSDVEAWCEEARAFVGRVGEEIERVLSAEEGSA